MTVPTVERGLRCVVFCSMAIAGERPSIESTSGLSNRPKNWRAYAERDSTYRRCPSAKIVSNASELLPEPERPEITTSASRGNITSIFFRLCSRAPFIHRLRAAEPTRTSCDTFSLSTRSPSIRGQTMRNFYALCNSTPFAADRITPFLQATRQFFHSAQTVR